MHLLFNTISKKSSSFQFLTSRILNSAFNKSGSLSLLLHSRLFSQLTNENSVDPQLQLQIPVLTKQDIKPIKQDILKESLKHPDFFGISNLFTVEDLFKAKVHLGHRDGTLNNYMRPYIFGSRLGHLIVDLDQTAVLLRESLNIAAHIAFRDGIILFVCRGVQHQELVEKTAEECKEFSHTRKWMHGLLTNATNLFGFEIRVPDLIIFISSMNDALNQHPCVLEASKKLIATIGIVDTNCDPKLITYPVPGNDDTSEAIQLYCSLYKRAILRGKERRKHFNLES